MCRSSPAGARWAATIAQVLAGKTGLRDAVSVELAADILWTYSAPELYGLLVLDRGWSPEHFGRFVGDSLVGALLNSGS